MSVQDEQFTFRGADGEAIAAYRWGAEGERRAILVVAHGMGEHARRYRSMLAGLLPLGIEIYAPDHRGHGATAVADRRGDFGPGGFPAVVDDLAILIRQVRAAHPSVPVILLGHSMGSFAAQLFVLDHADLIDGLALSGSAALDAVAAAVTGPEALPLLNRPFEPARTPFDWLSRDTAQVDLYMADPMCGFSLTPGSFISLFSGATRCADPNQASAIRKELPIYIFSGLDDPLASVMDALVPLIKRYQSAGFRVATDLYPGGRHEILNETNRAEVVENLKSWLNGVIADFG